MTWKHFQEPLKFDAGACINIHSIKDLSVISLYSQICFLAFAFEEFFSRGSEGVSEMSSVWSLCSAFCPFFVKMKSTGPLYQMSAYANRNKGVMPSHLFFLDKWACRFKNFYELWTPSFSEMLFYHKYPWLCALKVTDPNPEGLFWASFTSSPYISLCSFTGHEASQFFLRGYR